MKIDIPEGFLRELLDMTSEPKGERQCALCGEIRNQIIESLLAKPQEVANVLLPVARKRISAEGRARISKAQKQRWARVRAQKK